jgi:serine phosphatase RsbU (regulator of sigma subunit)
MALNPGDRLTFVSDGVVEARSKSGELFGFERTRQISCEPAEAIAKAAQRFGQEDDITVVTIEFAGVEQDPSISRA